MRDYNLQLYSPILLGKTYLTDIRGYTGWRRSTRRRGGYWRGSLTLYGDLGYLEECFYEWLGYHLEEKTLGDKTWEGILYEMVLDNGRISRVRSLDMMNNFVQATYIDNDGNTATTTAAQDAQSIARYERREDLLTAENKTAANANALRDTWLKERAWPWARPESGTSAAADISRSSEPSLELHFCGYIFTANWRYVTATSASTVNVSTWISDIIGTDCPLIVKGQIMTNTHQVKKQLDIKQRCWDTIDDLLNLGDGGTNFYTARIYNDRRFEYVLISNAPEYYIRDGSIYRSASDSFALHPRAIKPGVYRDLGYTVRRSELGSWFQQSTDFLTEEITVGDKTGFSWSSSEISETEQLIAAQEYAMSQDRRSSNGATGGKDGAIPVGRRHDTNWKRVFGLPEERWKEFDPNSKDFWKRKQAFIDEFRKKKHKAG